MSPFIQAPTPTQNTSSGFASLKHHGPLPQYHSQNSDTHYDLVGVVRHHGSFGGGHYTSVARHPVSREWMCFDDSHVYPVDENFVSDSQGYLYVYARNSNDHAKQFVQDALSTGPEEERTHRLARLWLSKVDSFSLPGPVDNFSLCCPHGLPAEPCTTAQERQLEKWSIPVSGRALELLLHKYGGGPVPRDISSSSPSSSTSSPRPHSDSTPDLPFPVNIDHFMAPSSCEDCRRDWTNCRRDQERKFIVSLDSSKKSGPWYLIGEDYLGKWRSYIMGKSDETPGPVENNVLLDESGQPKEGLKSTKDYRGLNEGTWNAFVQIYGGGPAIVRSEVDIYSPPQSPQSVEDMSES